MNDDIKYLPVKASSAVGVWLAAKTWSDIAAMLAALYTFCLLTEWGWKRVWKPLAQRMGWIKGPRREFLDSTGGVPLGDK